MSKTNQPLIDMLTRLRRYYDEKIFHPWTVEEAHMVHEAFPNSVDRIAADSARGIIDRIIKDIHAGEHRLPTTEERAA